MNRDASLARVEGQRANLVWLTESSHGNHGFDLFLKRRPFAKPTLG